LVSVVETCLTNNEVQKMMIYAQYIIIEKSDTKGFAVANIKVSHPLNIG
jgi:hypothetical protein